MAFSLVIIERPETDDARQEAWETFGEHLEPEDLKGVECVYCVGFNAWIFETATAMPQFATVIAGAKMAGLQLHVLHLNNQTFRVESSPKSEALEAFMKTA